MVNSSYAMFVADDASARASYNDDIPYIEMAQR